MPVAPVNPTETRSIMQQILRDARRAGAGFSKLHPYLRLGVGGLGAVAGLSALPALKNTITDAFNIGSYKRPEDDPTPFHQNLRDLSVYNQKRYQDMDMIRQAFMPKTASHDALLSCLTKKAAGRLPKAAPKKAPPARKPAPTAKREAAPPEKPSVAAQAPAVKQRQVTRQRAQGTAAPAPTQAPAPAAAGAGGSLMSPTWSGLPMAGKVGLGLAGMHYGSGILKDVLGKTTNQAAQPNAAAAALGQQSGLISEADTAFDRDLAKFNAARMLASSRLQALRGGMVAPNPYGATAGY